MHKFEWLSARYKAGSTAEFSAVSFSSCGETAAGLPKMVDTPILTLLCVTRAILLPLKFASASGSPQKWGNCSEMLSFKGWQISTFLLRYPGSRFNRHPALRILLGHSIQFWLQCNRTHRYTCYAIYPQVRCNSIWHSRKRLAKVSIFTPVFRLFPLIPVFHPCSKSSYSTGFSRTYAHFNSYYKSKENLFSQIRSIGKSPLSRFSLAPAATSKGGGCYSLQ